jgi:hypothetical protein
MRNKAILVALLVVSSGAAAQTPCEALLARNPQTMTPREQGQLADCMLQGTTMAPGRSQAVPPPNPSSPYSSWGAPFGGRLR